jgi:16S rRNA (cytosine1402-N4)-methyltransferase
VSEDHHGSEGPDEFHHLPVMVDRIVELLAPVPAGILVDATLGGGGHAAAILAAHPHLRLLGLDRDATALAAAAARLAPFGDRVELRHVRFDRLGTTVDDIGAREGEVTVTAALFDLGVSSPQLDRPDRGFSYRHDGPLDMRMDQDQVLTAADVVNGWDERHLAEVLRRNGDERFAGRIARAIVAARPIEGTARLAEVVRDAIPAPLGAAAATPPSAPSRPSASP